jgi:hypothetical protein
MEDTHVRVGQTKVRLSLIPQAYTRLGLPERHLCFLMILFCCSGYATPQPDSIFTSAKKSELTKLVGESERNNRPAEADSLYGVFDRCGALSVEQLYKWVQCRELLHRYAGAVGLYCRLLDADPRFPETVYRRLYRLFEDSPQDSIKHVMGVFEKCMLGRRGIDTVGERLKCAGFYAVHGLDSAEFNVLTAAPGVPGRLVSRLLDRAREQYAGRRYAAAILPALYVHERTLMAREKTIAAELLFQSYQALRRDDSALVWVVRTDMSREIRKVEAASLYQRARRLQEARSLIGTLSSSLSRDTLSLRQSLFEGDTRTALEFAQKMFAARPQDRDEMQLWNARVLLFDGDFGDLSALLDSVRPPASWPGASFLLDCRLMVKLLQNSREALAAWSHAEYDVFTGNPARAWGRFSEQRIPPDCRTILMVRIIKELLAQGDTAAVMPVFTEQGESVDSPEYLYMYAEFLLRTTGSEQTREAQKAQEVLLRIIRDYPEGVFSEKSRVLLAKIKTRN